MEYRGMTCQPLDSYEEIFELVSDPPAWRSLVRELTPHSPHKVRNSDLCPSVEEVRLESPQSFCHVIDEDAPPAPRYHTQDVPKTLVCHDMANGYHDDAFVDGTSVWDAYTFYNWPAVDIFCYFSHRLVTIPPLGWINTAHQHGVKVIGTLITEWGDGVNFWAEALETDDSIQQLASALTAIAKALKFEGWLLNIENKVAQPDRLLTFVRTLHTCLHAEVKDAELIWYDSVTVNGDLDWQNKLSDNNRAFFEACDGLFTNYSWTPKDVQESAVAAGDRRHDLYIGVDVWGRNFYGGGMFNTQAAVKVVHAAKCSLALFAVAWTHEALDPDPQVPLSAHAQWLLRDRALWGSLWPFLSSRLPSQLPFSTSFCRGGGPQRRRCGEVLSPGPWYNVRHQQYQPTAIHGPHGYVLAPRDCAPLDYSGLLRLRSQIEYSSDSQNSIANTDEETKPNSENTKSESQSKSTKPESDKTKTKTDKTEPDSEKSILIPDSSKPESEVTKPNSDNSKPEPTSTKPNSDNIKPEPTSTEPNSDNSKPESTSTKRNSDNIKPESTSTKPNSDNIKPEPMSTKRNSDNSKPEPTSTKPNSDNIKPESTSAKPKTEHTKPNSIRELIHTANTEDDEELEAAHSAKEELLKRDSSRHHIRKGVIKNSGGSAGNSRVDASSNPAPESRNVITRVRSVLRAALRPLSTCAECCGPSPTPPIDKGPPINILTSGNSMDQVPTTLQLGSERFKLILALVRHERECLELYSEDAFTGGGCLRVHPSDPLNAQHRLIRLFVCDFPARPAIVVLVVTKVESNHKSQYLNVHLTTPQGRHALIGRIAPPGQPPAFTHYPLVPDSCAYNALRRHLLLNQPDFYVPIANDFGWNVRYYGVRGLGPVSDINLRTGLLSGPILLGHFGITAVPLEVLINT